MPPTLTSAASIHIVNFGGGVLPPPGHLLNLPRSSRCEPTIVLQVSKLASSIVTFGNTGRGRPFQISVARLRFSRCRCCFISSQARHSTWVSPPVQPFFLICSSD